VSLSAAASLPPVPDFRYVGLEPSPRVHPRTWASVVGAGATLAAGLVHELGFRGLILSALGAAVTGFALRRAAGPSVRATSKRRSRVNRRALSSGRRQGSDALLDPEEGVDAEEADEADATDARAQSTRNRWRGPVRGVSAPMAIVPWGILVDPDASRRVLRWAAVKRVEVDMVHARDEGTSTTLWSVVTIETEHERYAGRAPGAVGIERLLAHLDAYAEEQSHAVALDLDGTCSVGEPFEPVIEPLLSAARSLYSRGGAAAARLGLPAGYRCAEAIASEETVAVLRGVLRDRAPRSPDPRALAAVLAGELHATPLAPDLLELVQSPHPILAGAAKAAAARLGVMATKVGAVSEVAPFLEDRDVEVLGAWLAPGDAARGSW
jgi:hypothetical protein